MADTAQLVKTNSYGFFGYVVPGVVVTLYMIVVVSYVRYDDPLELLKAFHHTAAEMASPGPYEYISFLLAFVVAAYIVGHLSEAGAQMIYDRFYMRRIYGHRLRQLILSEGTDRKETHKNFYRAAISSLYATAFTYLAIIAYRNRGWCDGFIGNAFVASVVIAILASIIGALWKYEQKARREEEKAADFLKDCEAAYTMAEELIRGEQADNEDKEKIRNLINILWERIRRDEAWRKWTGLRYEPLEKYFVEAEKHLKADEISEAKEKLRNTAEQMRTLSTTSEHTKKEEEIDFLTDFEAFHKTTLERLPENMVDDQGVSATMSLEALRVKIRQNKTWQKWANIKTDALAGYLAQACKHLDAEEFHDAKEELRKACKRMRALKGRNTLIVKGIALMSVVAETITAKFIDDERPISRQVKARFQEGFEKALGIKCGPALGSEVNRLPMWYIVEKQQDLSTFIVKYRAQAAMMCNISGAFLLCTLISVFAFQGTIANPNKVNHDRDFAIIGIVTLLISMFTSLRYFYIHDNDYVKTLIYAFVIGTTEKAEDKTDIPDKNGSSLAAQTNSSAPIGSVI